MKHLLHCSALLIAMLSLITFSSCEEDEDAAMAFQLSGYYEGTMRGTYYDKFGYPANTRWQTEFYFWQHDNYGGTGEEHDFSGRNTIVSRFSWEVEDGYIYLDFEDGSTVVARDYSLDYSRFRGYFDDLDGYELAKFDLRKVDGWLY